MHPSRVLRHTGMTVSLLGVALGICSCGVPRMPSFRSNATELRTPPAPVSPAGSGNAGTNMPQPNTSTKSQNGGTQIDDSLPASYHLKVPVQGQFPQLKNGCEATSVAMLLTAVGRPTNKMTVASMEPKDKTPIVYGPNNTIVSWGNPNVGFVGNVQGSPGYGIYHGPVVKLLKKIVPARAVDLTNRPFQAVLTSIYHGVPVVVWTTSTFEPTDDWVTWRSPEGPVHATFWEHAVLVVGYTPTSLIINDPIDGTQNKSVNRKLFMEAWEQLGRQAVTIRPNVGDDTETK